MNTDYDFLPWTDPETVFLWDCKFAFSSGEQKIKIRYPLIWALVHSRDPVDVIRGMGMLRDSLASTGNFREKKKELYLLAVAYFRCKLFTKSAETVDKCLELKPNCWKALNLKEVIAYCGKKYGLSSVVGDSTSSSVEFLSRVLTASKSTPGIENIPEWVHPVILKKSHELSRDKDDTVACIIGTTLGLGVGFLLMAVVARSLIR